MTTTAAKIQRRIKSEVFSGSSKRIDAASPSWYRGRLEACVVGLLDATAHNQNYGEPFF
jgi:hypothetical protein